METKTIILSKNTITSELNLEFVVDEKAINNIIQARYLNQLYKIIKPSELPKYFFEFQSCFDIINWSTLEFAIKNISKAKEICLEHYRRARTPLLEKLDLEYMRADEAGNLELKKEIASKKQALRDVTKIDLPNTLEEIKATWPEILGKNPFSS